MRALLMGVGRRRPHMAWVVSERLEERTASASGKCLNCHPLPRTRVFPQVNVTQMGNWGHFNCSYSCSFLLAFTQSVRLRCVIFIPAV